MTTIVVLLSEDMKRTSKAQLTGQIPAADAWHVISKGGDVHRWFGAAITACEHNGNGVGARRSCVMADGGKLEEKIIAVDDNLRRFVHAGNERPLPASNVIATIVVNESGNNAATLQWSAEGECEEQHSRMMDQTLSGLYEQGIRSLETYCRPAA